MSFLARLALVGAVLAASLAAVPSAFAAAQPGVQRMSFRAGPYQVKPGQNTIDFAPTSQKPAVDGYIVGIRPNLKRADGSVPRSDDIMFHHAVWLNLDAKDVTRPPLPERFFAAGEEKTNLRMPNGYGYAYKASDRWLLNYMIHNLKARADTVYITYDIDFVPATSPAAAKLRPARPAWMDVENNKVYPVFDSLRGTGTKGRFTYPTQKPDAYAGRKRENTWTVDRDSVLIGTAGHLHAGGLWNDLYVTRKGRRAHLFRSKAKYFEPLGPVSWDVAMTVTPDRYRVGLKKGDVLSTTVTYESKRASWYESMGIMVSWLADSGKRVNPFEKDVAVEGKVTHGHLNENRVHGGKRTNLPNPETVGAGAFSSNLAITGFGYLAPGLSGGRMPAVRRGRSLTFTSPDAARDIFHSVTSCKLPCNRSTGIAYPIANGEVDFDSGQLGNGGPPTVNRTSWSTPKSLKPGTYSYFCRIHPFMRGAFRVKK